MFAITSRWAAALCSLSVLALASQPSAQVPDVITYDIGVDGGNTNDIHYYGQFGGIAAYSIATQSCNSGTKTVDWFTAGGSTLHPVIGQNMFRLKDGRFEHVGQSWLKHGFCAVNEIEANCAPCQSTPCDTLGIGCADTYWASLNDGQGGQSKVNINAAEGSHVHGGSPTGNAAIRGRLQVPVTDIDPAQNAGAEWFIEGHYVTRDDAQAGNDGNNASWRRVNVLAVNNIDGGGPTHRGEPAIYAWQDIDRDVEIRQVVNIEDGNNKTIFLLGFRATPVGGGVWHYEYAIQNLNSHQSAGSFSVPVDSVTDVTNIGFHDVAYHSGDPYDGTDWPGVENGGEVSWATTPFSTNANANALRWGTIYNFRFDAEAEPTLGTVTLGLFRPSLSTHIDVPNVLVPGDPRVLDPVPGAELRAARQPDLGWADHARVGDDPAHGLGHEREPARRARPRARRPRVAGRARHAGREARAPVLRPRRRVGRHLQPHGRGADPSAGAARQARRHDARDPRHGAPDRSALLGAGGGADGRGLEALERARRDDRGGVAAAWVSRPRAASRSEGAFVCVRRGVRCGRLLRTSRKHGAPSD